MIRSIWNDGPKQLSFFDTPGPVVIAYSGRTARPLTTPPPSQYIVMQKTPASEIQARRDAKQRLDIMRRRDIEHAASWARHLWRKYNAQGRNIDGHVVVCADDVREVAGIMPVKNSRENNWMGCIFTCKIPGKNKWRKVTGIGEHSSTVKGSHGNGQSFWEMLPEKWPVEK